MNLEEKVTSENKRKYLLAIAIFCITIIIPFVFSYLFLGNSFWRIILIAGCCLISVPFFALLGFGRSGAPLTPNQLLSRLMNFSKAKETEKKEITVQMDKTKEITFIDIVKGVIFSIILVILYLLIANLYGFLIHLVL